MNLMDEETARAAIVEAGALMCDHGHVVSNDGNISVRIAPDRILITPTGVSKGALTAESLVVMDLDGNEISRGERGASSEAKMHLRVYREDPEVTAVVHAHPIYATAFAIAGVPLDLPILSEAMLQVGAVPVARYAKPGTDAVPESIAPFVRGGAAVLLSNHGALTWGATLEQAAARMEVLENYARITLTVQQIGSCRGLSAEQVEGLAGIRAAMGLAPVAMPRGEEIAMNDTDVLPATQPEAPTTLLRPELIRVHQAFETQEEALRSQARQFVELGVSKESFPQAIVDRERVYPTGLPAEAFDIAISHCDSEHVNESAIGVTLLDEPVEFQMMGGMSDEPLHPRLIFMLAIKDPKAQVPTLQKMMGVIQDKALLERLLAADTAQAVYDELAPVLTV